MRLAARFSATLAFAFLMVPALYAGGAAKPGAKTKKTAPVASVAPSPTAKAGSKTSKVLPARFSANRKARARHERDDSEAYTPKVEWFLGYSFWRAMPTATSNRMGYLHGGSTSVAYNFNRYLGLVADFGGYDNNKLTLLSPSGDQTFDANGSAYTYLFGPRLSYRMHERFTPFAQALFGAAHASSVTISGCTSGSSCTPLGSENAFAMTVGGGLDITLHRHIALRLFQAEYLMTRFKDSSVLAGQTERQNNLRLSTGIVVRFGGHHAEPLPSRPPVATCSVDKSTVYAGSGDTVTVRADASDPDNNPLTYSWTASGGTVEGNSSEARWSSSGMAPGTYTVKVRVDDGKGGTADCSGDIRVEPRPNRPPTLSCSADRTSIVQGESSGITANGSDPDNDPLTYSYTSTGGQITGSGAKVQFDSTGAPAGTYEVKCNVSDGRGGRADASTSVEVQAPPPPPEVVALEARLALHSIYFQTARPTVQNPGGGLVESQQKVLASLATDFQRYLTFKPDAHLTLGGHADVRGSVEFNKALTERRVERTKNFLVEHGVPSGSIETRSFGEADNLDADEVKQQMQENPDLSPDDRRQMLNNLQVIVLANNRRVDVTLSTTGQQSVRRYPFNARDAMALINTEGTGTHKTGTAATRKKRRKQ